jgi:hypothetical protein
VRILVIGGGPVGQLFKVAVPSAEIFEYLPPPTDVSKRSTRSWGANYLWKPIPGVACRSFKVITHIDGEPANKTSILNYKKKVGKGDEPQWDWEEQFQTITRGYEMVSPPDVEVNWGYKVERIDLKKRTVRFDRPDHQTEHFDVLISTVPLYVTLAMCGLPRDSEPWRSSPIYVRVIQRPPDARFPVEDMYVNYISRLDQSVYRVTDRDGQRHFEDLRESPWDAKKLVPGKIYAHTKTEYYRELLAAHNVFTFGRYGSWNTSELIHHTWDFIVDWRESFIPNYAG